MNFTGAGGFVSRTVLNCFAAASRAAWDVQTTYIINKCTCKRIDCSCNADEKQTQERRGRRKVMTPSCSWLLTKADSPAFEQPFALPWQGACAHSWTNAHCQWCNVRRRRSFLFLFKQRNNGLNCTYMTTKEAPRMHTRKTVYVAAAKERHNVEKRGARSSSLAQLLDHIAATISSSTPRGHARDAHATHDIGAQAARPTLKMA